MTRFAVAALALIAVASSATAQTSNYPDRPVRLIVPFPAGSATDSIGRIVAQKLSTRLGQQFVVENRPGASGNLGSDLVAKSAADGYTIGLITGSTHAVAPALGSKLPYDPVKDFSPISMIGASPYVLVVYPGLPIKSLADLVALAKAQPGKLNYGSAGPASLAHLGTAQFALQTGIDIKHVPYRSSAQSSIDLITGRLEMQLASIAPVLENIRDGKLRAVATSGRKRVGALPDVPTMSEAGVPDYEVSLWMALALPAATPEEIVSKLNAEMKAVLTSADIVEAMQKQGFEPEPTSPSAVIDRIRGETEQWRTLIDKTGIRPE